MVQAFNENTEKEVVNINESWTFTNYDNKSSTVNLPYCWEYVHPTMSYIPQMNSKTCTYEKTLDVSKYKNKNLFLKYLLQNHLIFHTHHDHKFLLFQLVLLNNEAHLVN